MVFVGIDVLKQRLDVALRPGEEVFEVANSARGIAQLVRRLKKLSADGIVLEASGGFELAAVSELAAAGLPVMVVNPRQVRDFARARKTRQNRHHRRRHPRALCRGHAATAPATA
jgi:transposase